MIIFMSADKYGSLRNLTDKAKERGIVYLKINFP